MLKVGRAATVGVMAAWAGLAAAPAAAGPVFGQSSYSSTLALANNGTGGATTGVSFANGAYTTVQGGSAATGYVAQYSVTGTLLQGPAAATPNTDFRAIFTDASGNVYARGLSSSALLKQSGAYNNFVSAGITLQGTVSAQAQVTFSDSLQQFVANNNRTLSFYNLDGSVARTLALGATSSPNDIAIYGSYGINESGGTLRAYDLTTGAVVDSASLTGTLGINSINYGQAYANGYFFAEDSTNKGLVGYYLGAAAAPEPATWALMIGGFGAVGVALRRRRSLGGVPAKA